MKRATTLKPPKRISTKVVDADNPPWREEMLGHAVVRRGRGPQRAPTKALTSLRIDADVLEYFRSSGPGFQTRINEALRREKERGEARAATSRVGLRTKGSGAGVVDAPKPPEVREPKTRYRAAGRQRKR